MGVVGAALRGFGKALKRGKHLRPSKTGAIKSVKPGVGGLKASSAMKDQLSKSTAVGVERFGRPHTTKVLSEQKGKKSFGSIVKQAGDLERTKKAMIKKHPELKGRKGFRGGGRTNLLEELGRVEAEPSNRNRRAEISRVHSELNKGYKKGGKA